MTKSKAKISEFRPQRQNANKHTARGLGMLDKSMGENGFIGAMTSAADGEIFDGSARLETAYERFGDDIEPIIIDADGTRPIIVRRFDIPNADDPKAKKLAIAANRIAQVDLDWDADILASIADEVDISDMFFEEELAGILDGDEEEILINTDRSTNPKEDAEGYLNSSVRQFVLTYPIDEYDLVLGFFELLISRFNVENNADALKALAQNYE